MRLCPERHYNLGEGRGHGGEGGVVRGGGGAAPVGATLFSPFLINQSWVHHSPAPVCWCRFWVPPAGLLGPGSGAGGGRIALVLECLPGYVPLVTPRDTGRPPLPYVCPHTQTSHSSGVLSSSQVPFFGGTQPLECSQLQVWLLQVTGVVLGFRDPSSAHSPMAHGEQTPAYLWWPWKPGGSVPRGTS